MTDINEIPPAPRKMPLHCLRFPLKGVWFDKIKSGETDMFVEAELQELKRERQEKAKKYAD